MLSNSHQNFTERPTARALAVDESTNDLEDMQDDVDVPDDVEHILEELFEALQDKVWPSLHTIGLISPHIDRIRSCGGRQLKALQGLPNAFPKTSQVRFWKQFWDYSRSIPSRPPVYMTFQLSQRAHGTVHALHALKLQDVISLNLST